MHAANALCAASKQSRTDPRGDRNFDLDTIERQQPLPVIGHDTKVQCITCPQARLMQVRQTRGLSEIFPRHRQNRKRFTRKAREQGQGIRARLGVKLPRAHLHGQRGRKLRDRPVTDYQVIRLLLRQPTLYLCGPPFRRQCRNQQTGIQIGHAQYRAASRNRRNASPAPSVCFGIVLTKACKRAKFTRFRFPRAAVKRAVGRPCLAITTSTPAAARSANSLSRAFASRNEIVSSFTAITLRPLL